MDYHFNLVARKGFWKCDIRKWTSLTYTLPWKLTKPQIDLDPKKVIKIFKIELEKPEGRSKKYIKIFKKLWIKLWYHERVSKYPRIRLQS